MTKCPQCGRTLREHERYCDFCEQDVTETVEKEEGSQLGKDLQEVFSKIKGLFQKKKE